MRGEGLVVIHGSTVLAVVLWWLESLLHERVLVRRVLGRIRLNEIAVILLNGVASFRFLLNAYLIIGVSALIAGVAAQAAVLVRRIPDVFFVLIFNYHLLEQVVRRVRRLSFL